MMMVLDFFYTFSTFSTCANSRSCIYARKTRWLVLCCFLVVVLTDIQVTDEAFALSSSTTATATTHPLKGLKVTSVVTGNVVDIGEYLLSSDTTATKTSDGGNLPPTTTSSSSPSSSKSSSSSSSTTPRLSMFIFGTYAADFNTIEYGQKLRYYLHQLQTECCIEKVGFLINCTPHAAMILTKDELDLPIRQNVQGEYSQDKSDGHGGGGLQIDLFVDNTGEVSRRWGVNRGLWPNNPHIHPYLKLFIMLPFGFGDGVHGTFPAIMNGYLGNPCMPCDNPWIQDAFAIGQINDRWPNDILELSCHLENDEVHDKNNRVSSTTLHKFTVLHNKFSDFPYVGNWGRRPFELATLRLQSMIGISIKQWQQLGPNQEALDNGVLTQMGGCLVINADTGEIVYDWKDNGECCTANFETMIQILQEKVIV